MLTAKEIKKLRKLWKKGYEQHLEEMSAEW